MFVVQLQKNVTFTRVTGATEASVKALGYEKVRQDIVLNFLKGNDVFVSLPTGGGTSLCYACLPFVYDRLREDTSRSIALVISPLNALMQDQVTSFTKRGMTGVHVCSDCSLSLVDKIVSGEVQLIYMSPEAILTVPTWREMFRNHCYQDNLICVAVDEAHSVEKWCVCVCVHACVCVCVCVCVRVRVCLCTCIYWQTQIQHSPLQTTQNTIDHWFNLKLLFCTGGKHSEPISVKLVRFVHCYLSGQI